MSIPRNEEDERDITYYNRLSRMEQDKLFTSDVKFLSPDTQFEQWWNEQYIPTDGDMDYRLYICGIAYCAWNTALSFPLARKGNG